VDSHYANGSRLIEFITITYKFRHQEGHFSRMRNFVRICEWFYAQSLKLYPSSFRGKFGDEMQTVFSRALEKAVKDDVLKFLAFFGREIRNWPKAVFQEHLRAWKGSNMKQNYLAWRPLNTKELLAGLALFVLPMFSPILKLIFGYKTVIINIGYIFTLAILIIVIVIIILGIKNGFPRWSIPYLGVSITTIIMLQAVYPLWGIFATDIKRMINYSTKTLVTRIQYSALLNGFFWLVPFVALILLILLLKVWPRTRVLAQCIRNDWTLLSFMIYGGVVFDLELVFEEYAYDEPWKIACWTCLAFGALIYFKTADHRKRILTLLVGVTLTFWIVAVGKWIVLPIQNWGGWYGNDDWTYRRFELGRTLAEWGWVLFFMLLPALLTRIPRTKQPASVSEETRVPA
jgi:hypothetical protein